VDKNAVTGIAWQPFRGPFQRWPRLADFMLSVVSFVLTLNMWADSRSESLAIPTGTDGLTLVLVIAGSFSLLWRRRFPLRVHAIILACSLGVQLGSMSDGIFALTFSLYSLGRYENNDRTSLLGMLAALAFVSTDLFLFSDPNPGSFIAASFVMLLWYIGRRLRFRGEYLRLLEERTVNLERARTIEAEQAVHQERTRIARELHDIVAHQVSLMTVQAGAAKTVALSNPQAAVEAMAAVEKAGRQALSEMRHLLNVLRPDKVASERSPQPGCADLPRLVQEVSGAGPDVRLLIEGNLENLPARLDLAVYRITQEALTNVLKHAGPGVKVEVVVRSGSDAVELCIRDDGQGSAKAKGSGHGIEGMRERATLLNGTLHAAAADNGGFEVRAHLPYKALES